MIQKLTKKLILTAAVFFSSAVIAQTVVISEVGFKSTSSDEDFVELYNTTGSAISLVGYTLVPSTGSTVTLTGSIPANGYYVIGKNSTEATFETAWGVSIGGTSVYQNSSTVLSNASGVTFSLKDGGSTEIDNTVGYGITLGTRLYQCPVGSFLGNDQIETTTSSCSPGSVNSLSVDDLTHWTISRYNNSWDVGFINSTTGSDNLIIKRFYYYPISGDQINDVYLVDDSYITDLSNSTLTVNGDLYISNASSIVITGTGEVAVTGSIYLSRTGESTSDSYNLWSTPFSDPVDIETTFTGANPCDLYTYNATTQEWKYDYSVPYATTCVGNPVTITSANTMVDGVSDGNFDIGRGYFLPGSSSDPTRVFEGSSLNNGNISVPVYGSSVAITGGNDWNLIGNPYPCGLTTYDFLNNTNNATLINTVYKYVGDGGYYVSYNSATTGRYLSSCQGFYVNVTSATDGLIGNLEFTNSMRNKTVTQWRNASPTIFMSLVFDSLSDPIQIILDEDAEDLMDTKHDAFKLINPNYLNIASAVESELLVFNGVKPVNDSQTKTIKLFVQTPESGNYEINLDSLNLIDQFMDIKLEDKNDNSFTDLRNGSFSFSTTIGETFTDRFFLHLTNTVTSIKENNALVDASIYFSDETINVTIIGSSNIDNVTIFDITGREVHSSIGTSNTMEINTNSFGEAIFIVQVTDDLGRKTTQRVFVK